MDELIKAVQNRFKRRSAILEKEIEKYDQLQESVGKIITHVIDQPLQSIERLSQLLRSEADGLRPEDIKEISQLICENSKNLRLFIREVIY